LSTVLIRNTIRYLLKNINKKEIIKMEVILRDADDAKEKVEKTLKYLQSVLMSLIEELRSMKN
jgi:hypothetical protein